MGVIRKLLFRGEVLSRPRHRNIFLDMEENIHIHYRDLRIELGRGEFEDFSNAFIRQSAELRAIIDSTDYQDGKLPNANREDVRIWLDSRLKHELRYHPTRISLEECTDGYHLHYRNYKILIDRDDFVTLQRIFAGMEVDSPYARSYQDVLALIEVNDIDFSLGSGNVPGQTLVLSVAKYHRRKVEEILESIGLCRVPGAAPLEYQGAQVRILVTVDGSRGAGDFRRLRARRRARPLADFLTEQGRSVDPLLLNRIKCEVLELHGRIKSGEAVSVDPHPDAWMVEPDGGQLVFPYASEAVQGARAADELYQRWSALLARTGLGFVKPPKQVFEGSAQQELAAAVRRCLMEELACVPTVARIHLMGSAARGEMGVYQEPFVHGRLAKLGSDVDILIELDAGLERVPRGWKFINHSATNECDVYHVAQIPLAGDRAAEMRRRYPHVEFLEHLVDAYVHFPSLGQADKKDAFLQRFRAQLVYDRERDGPANRAEVAPLLERLAQDYGWQGAALQRMDVSTRNEIYWIRQDTCYWVLKKFVVSGNYPQARIAEHTRYECELVEQLIRRGVPTAAVLRTRAGEALIELDGVPAVMFAYLPGQAPDRPGAYPLAAVAAAIAALQQAQAEPLALDSSFTFLGLCGMWLDAFFTYRDNPELPDAIREDFQALQPLVERLRDTAVLEGMMARTVILHCHGDLNPKNVLIQPDASVQLFDFNNAFYGPRLADPLDAAYEFSLGGKYVAEADFDRFNEVMRHYTARCPLSSEEYEDWSLWRGLVGVIKFTKEVRARFESGGQGKLRLQRAHLIAAFLRAQNH